MMNVCVHCCDYDQQLNKSWTHADVCLIGNKIQDKYDIHQQLIIDVNNYKKKISSFTSTKTIFGFSFQIELGVSMIFWISDVEYNYPYGPG